MTVAQLIERLSKIPPDTAVKVMVKEGGNLRGICRSADLTGILHYRGGAGRPVIFLKGKEA